MKKNDLPCCDAIVHREGVTTIQRIHFHESGQCTRKGRVVMHNPESPGKTFYFCNAHARMGDDGFVDGIGETMDPNSRADYQRGRATGKPMHYGIWKRGNAPKAPTLDKAQIKLLARSAKDSGRSWGNNVNVRGSTVEVAGGLQKLGLGHVEEYEEDGKPGMKFSFSANAGGLYLSRQSKA